MENKKNTVILARVSSREQEETGYSLPAQIKLLEEYVKRTDGLVLAREPFEISESASKSDQRKVFKSMMDYVDEHKILHIVVEKVDRHVRNLHDAVDTDIWLRTDPLRKVHFVKDSLVLHTNSRSQEWLNWGIRVVIAKNYIDNLREEVAKGVKEKLEQGWYPGTKPPIGYKHSGDKGHKTQVIDRSMSPLVQLAFELYDTGNYSIKSLTEELKNQGVTNKVGKPISKSYMHMLLTNKFYIGVMTWMGKEYKGQYKTFIDEELFWRVQGRLSSGTTPKVQKELTLLKSKVKCEDCGSTISWYAQKGNWYGECKGNKPCNVHECARQDAVEAELAEYFSQLIAPSPAIIAWVKKELRQSHHHEIEQYNAAVDKISSQQRRLDHQIKMLYEDRLDGRITAEAYDKKVKEKTQQRDELVQQLGKLTSNNTDYIQQGIDILELTQNAAQIFREKPVEEQRVLLGDIFSNITLNGKHLKVVWREETELVRNAVENTKRLEKILEPSADPSKMVLTEACRSIWLRRLDSNQQPRS